MRFPSGTMAMAVILHRHHGGTAHRAHCGALRHLPAQRRVGGNKQAAHPGAGKFGAELVGGDRTEAAGEPPMAAGSHPR